MYLQFGAIGAQTSARLQAWLRSEVGCRVGRSQFHVDRFVFAAVRSPAELEAVRRLFACSASACGKTSCMILVEPDNPDLAAGSAAQVLDHLEQHYFATERAGQRPYRLTLRLACPVTGCPVDYPDFDQVAFYPQAGDPRDPLYDPSMVAPTVAINITSDLFAFSSVVADLSRRRHGCAPHELAGDAARDALFASAVRVYQRLAVQTIEAYERQTDARRLCPIHLEQDQRHYVSPHDEAAFSEREKLGHVSEMPAIYCQRLIGQWQRYFRTGRAPELADVYRPAQVLANGQRACRPPTLPGARSPH